MLNLGLTIVCGLGVTLFLDYVNLSLWYKNAPKLHKVIHRLIWMVYGATIWQDFLKIH
jgi:hypothetical protein